MIIGVPLETALPGACRVGSEVRSTILAGRKHLAVLSGAGLVARRPKGRETLYALRPERLAETRAWLDAVAAQWEAALGRLKAHVEG